MFSGSSWAGRGDRALASVEHPRQRRLTAWKDEGIRGRNDWEDKRARCRVEFVGPIPAMAADMASEISAAVASEVNAAVAAALDAMFVRQREAILDAVTALDRARVSSTTTPTSSSSDTHAPTVALACTSSSIQTALATPTTCSTQCPSSDVTVSLSALAPAATSVSSKVAIGIVSKHCCCEPEPTVVTSIPICTMDVSGAQAPAAIEPGLFTALPMTIYVVCLNPIHVAPAPVLIQATLDTMDSSGAVALVAMLAQLDTPEGADTVVTHEDEQLLASPRVERSLTVVASDVADDHSFIACTSAMSLTLAALGVHDGRITNGDKVILPPLKLMEMTLLETKQQNMSPFLPKVTQAMVAWGTSLNQLHTKYNGMCSDLVSATGCLLPWDSGEKTWALRYSVLSTDIVWGTGVKQLNADSSDNHSHHKSGYAKIQKYFYWPIQDFCSSQNVLGKRSCKGIFVELLRYQFDSAGYPQVPLEYFLVGSFCDIWIANWRSNEFRSCILWSHSMALLILACENVTLKESIEQRDPGIARLVHICTQYCHVSCLLISCPGVLTNGHHILRGNTHYSELIECSLQSELRFCILENILFCCVLEQWKIPSTVSLVSLKSQLQYYSIGRESLYKCKNWPSLYQEKWFRFLTMRSFSGASACVCSGIVTNTFWPHFKLGILPPLRCKYSSFWRYPNVDQMMLNTGHIKCGLDLIYWEIAWPLSLVCSTTTIGNKYGNLFQRTKLRCEGTATALPFQLLAYIAVWSFRSLEFCQGKLSWDPGIWALCFFFGLFTQLEAKGGRNVSAASCYRIHYLGLDYYDKICGNQDYYINIFQDQVHIGHDYYLVCAVCYHLVKVCFKYNFHCSLGKVVNHQVPWDPGGSRFDVASA